MKRRATIQLPPPIGAAVFERILREVPHESLEETRATFIAAGIMTPTGQLAEHYRETPSRGRKRIRRTAVARRSPRKRRAKRAT